MIDELVMEYEFVRQSGETNMLQRATVRRLAQEHSFHKLAEVASDSRRYANFLWSYVPPTVDDYRKWLDSVKA